MSKPLVLPALHVSLCFLLIMSNLSLSLSSPNPHSDGDFYTAGVVEFSANMTLSLQIPSPAEALQHMMYNLHSYEQYVQEGQSKGVDIIVFPEDGIYGFLFLNREQIFPFLEDIPDPRGKPVLPCGNSSFSDRPVLSWLSCLARQYEVTVVANMGDKQKCSATTTPKKTCPPNGWFQYNTDVIFDSDGSLIAKYHKAHLYGQESDIFDTPDPIPHVNFTTSFGVTFGTFTCYDILFCDPPLELVDAGISNFVFPTAWGNSYPFYTSIAFQQAWSRKTQSNFLAANQHFPNAHSFAVDLKFYLTGSGIYSSGYAATSYISGDNFPPATGKLLTATLLKDPSIFQQNWPIKSDSKNDGKILDAKCLNDGSQDLIQDRQNYRSPHKPRESERKLRSLRQTHAWPQLQANVSNIDMASNTYLNFTALGSQQQGQVMASYSSGQLHLDCSVSYTADLHTVSETYALGAYIGQSKDDPKLSFAVCSLVKCATSELKTCGQPVRDYRAETQFRSVAIEGSFPEGSTVFPVVLLDQLQLAGPGYIKLDEHSLTVQGLDRPLLSASLWSRVDSGDSRGLYQCRTPS